MSRRVTAVTAYVLRIRIQFMNSLITYAQFRKFSLQLLHFLYMCFILLYRKIRRESWFQVLGFSFFHFFLLRISSLHISRNERRISWNRLPANLLILPSKARPTAVIFISHHIANTWRRLGQHTCDLLLFLWLSSAWPLSLDSLLSFHKDDLSSTAHSIK